MHTVAYSPFTVPRPNAQQVDWVQGWLALQLVNGRLINLLECD